MNKRHRTTRALYLISGKCFRRGPYNRPVSIGNLSLRDIVTIPVGTTVLSARKIGGSKRYFFVVSELGGKYCGWGERGDFEVTHE